MTIVASEFFSDIARSGPPLFFPDPPVPVTFNFDQGVPGEETFPLEELRALHEEILARDGGRAMEYISMDFDHERQRILYLSTYIELVLGNTALRTELAGWLNRKNDRDDIVADGIILTSGSVQAIALAVNALVSPGDGVLVEAATFPYALRYFQMRGADLRAVAVDGEGIDVDALEARLAEMRSARGHPEDALHRGHVPTAHRGLHEPRPSAPADRVGRGVQLPHSRRPHLRGSQVLRGAVTDPAVAGHAGPGAAVTRLQQGGRAGPATGLDHRVAGVGGRTRGGASGPGCEPVDLPGHGRVRRSRAARPAHRTHQRRLPAQAGCRRGGRPRALLAVGELRPAGRRVLPVAGVVAAGGLGQGRGGGRSQRRRVPAGGAVHAARPGQPAGPAVPAPRVQPRR